MTDLNKFSFTKAKLNGLAIPNSKKEVTVFDEQVHGLSMRFLKSGKKIFQVRKKFNGKMVRVKLGDNPYYPDMSIEQARRKAREVLNKFSEGINPNLEKKTQLAKSVTLQDCLIDYIKVHHNLAQSTKASYKAALRKYLSDWKNKQLLEISREMIEKRHLQIGKQTKTRANHTMRLLRALFNFAHGEYENEAGEPIFLHNPVSRISHKKLWFKEKRRSSFISPSDLPKWYQSVQSMPEWLINTQANTDSLKDYFLFILFTGLRRRECAQIKKDWINIQNRSLIVPEDQTKNGYEHQLPLSNFLMEIVNKRLKLEGDFLFSGKTSDGYIKEPKRIIAKVRDHSGVYFTLHDLRRTFITNAENLGYSGYTLKRLLNHRVKSDVTDEYIVTDIENLRPVMQAVTDRILSIIND